MKKYAWIKMTFVTCLLLTLVFGLTGTAQAFSVRETGVVTSDEVIDDDLFLAGDTVRMDGTINGILFATGNRVTVNGTVNGDLFFAGRDLILGEDATVNGNIFAGAQSLVIRGDAEGSLFAGTAATTITETSNIGRNVYFGGYHLEVMDGALVGKDLAVGGYQLILNGEVVRDVHADVGAFQLAGKIGRNALVSVAEPSGTEMMTPYYYFGGQPLPEAVNPGLFISETASIGGDLIYSSPVEQTDAVQSTPAGQMIYQTPVPDETEQQVEEPAAKIDLRTPFLNAIWNFFRGWITLSILGVLAVKFVPSWLNRFSERIYQKPLPSFGYGLLVYFLGWGLIVLAALVLIAVSILLAVISFGGLGAIVFWSGGASWLAIVVGFSILIAYGTKLIASFLIGRAVLQGLFKQTQVSPYWIVLLGVLIYMILRTIPFLGALIAFLVIMFGLGAIWLTYRAARTQSIQTPSA